MTESHGQRLSLINLVYRTLSIAEFPLSEPISRVVLRTMPGLREFQGKGDTWNRMTYENDNEVVVVSAMTLPSFSCTRSQSMSNASQCRRKWTTILNANETSLAMGGGHF